MKKITLDYKRMWCSKVFYGKERTLVPDNNKFSQHMHNAYEILFIIKGEGEHIIEDSHYQLSPNTLILIKPHKYHFVKISEKDYYERVSISFSEDFLDKTLADRVFNKQTCLKLQKNAPIVDVFCRLEKYFDDYNEEDFLLLFQCLQIEMLMLIDSEKSIGNDFKHFNDLTNKAIDFINENLQQIFSLDDIANALFVSKSTLYHTFNKNMKISLMQYVKNKKLLYAHSLIQNGVRPTVAYVESGFKDYTTFFRSYKKHFKVSPSEVSYFDHNLV